MDNALSPGMLSAIAEREAMQPTNANTYRVYTDRVNFDDTTWSIPHTPAPTPPNRKERKRRERIRKNLITKFRRMMK